MKIVAVHRVLPTNTGDIASAPTLWAGAPFAGADHIDVLDGTVDRIADSAHTEAVWIIVGGGGLFGNEWFHEPLERLAELVEHTPNLHVVVWGAGWNTHHDREPRPSPRILDVAELVGVRDVGTGHRVVPCASVLHPAFERVGRPRHRVVVYTHQRDRALRAAAEAASVPTMVNSGPDVGAAIDFIASGATVITGSYHGAYWATLAGRRTAVCGAFSTKFDHLWRPVPCDRGVDLAAAEDAAVDHPDAYDDARDTNQAFAAELAERIAA